MSDEQKINDNAIIELVRDAVAEYGAYGMKADKYLNPYEIDTFVHAALRTMFNLKAKESALLDELARVYNDIADLLEGDRDYVNAKRYRTRAALAARARDAGDGADGDGERGAE